MGEKRELREQLGLAKAEAYGWRAVADWATYWRERAEDAEGKLAAALSDNAKAGAELAKWEDGEYCACWSENGSRDYYWKNLAEIAESELGRWKTAHEQIRVSNERNRERAETAEAEWQGYVNHIRDLNRREVGRLQERAERAEAERDDLRNRVNDLESQLSMIAVCDTEDGECARECPRWSDVVVTDAVPDGVAFVLDRDTLGAINRLEKNKTDEWLESLEGRNRIADSYRCCGGCEDSVHGHGCSCVLEALTSARRGEPWCCERKDGGDCV